MGTPTRSAASHRACSRLANTSVAPGRSAAAARLARDPDPPDLFWRGALAAAEGRWADFERIRVSLEDQAYQLDAPELRRLHEDRAGAEVARGYAAALDAFADLMRGESAGLADFESALAMLTSLGWDIEQPHQYLRYQVGRTLFERGKLREAERYFRTFGPYDYFYTSQAELFLGRIAEALGRPGDAMMHYGRFLRWWQHADPSLRPQWEEARDALTRLAAESPESS